MTHLQFRASAIPAGWGSAKVGAGGLVTGIDIAPDGTTVCRADVFGAYLFQRDVPSLGNAGGLGRWKQLITTASFASYLSLLETPLGAADGAYEIRVAPSDSTILYMVYLGYVWRSADRGTTWAQTAFTRDVGMAGNRGAQRVYMYKMAIDPVNSDVVYLTTYDDGGYYTRDAGATWSAISGLPVNDSTCLGCVAIDGSSSNSSTPTRKSVVYATASGSGLYKSTDGGGSFSSVSGGPGTSATLNELQVSSNGTVFVVDYATSKLWRLVSSTWTDITPTGTGTAINGVSIHPTDPDNVIAWTYNGGGRETTSATSGTPGGGMWAAINTADALTATDIPWIGTLLNSNFASGILAPRWDPSDTTKLWAAAMQSVVNITHPLATGATPVALTNRGAGIEEIVANETVVPQGYAPLFLGHDIGIIRQPGLLQYATAQVYNTAQFLSYASAAAYAPNDSRFVVTAHDKQGGKGAYSTDAGATWTSFATAIPSGLGGSIACTSTEIILVSGNAGRPYYSNDRGTTWSLITGLPDNNRWNNDSSYNRHIVTADHVNIGTFYVMATNGYGQTSPGLYKISNNAGTVDFYATTIDLGANSRLRAVPGNAGHLFFTSGPQGSGYGSGSAGDAASNWPHNQLFYYSTDGGQNWADVGALSSNNWTIREVWSFGFGKAKPGGSGYPVIYLYGFVVSGSSPAPSGSTPGFWKSEDGGATWSQFGVQYPNGWPDWVSDVNGDMDVYGRVYVGSKGSGWQYYQL